MAGGRVGRSCSSAYSSVGHCCYSSPACRWATQRAPLGNAAPSEVLLRTGLSAVVVYALLAAVLFALVRVVAQLSPEPPNARFVEFLARTLEARPLTE